MLGFFFAIVSIIMISQIISSQILRKEASFLDKWLINISTSPVGFFAPIILVALGVYVLVTTQLGIIKFGFRFLFINFYPIAKNETFANAFFVNCTALNAVSVSVAHMMTDLFSGYLKNTEVHFIFKERIERMWVFNVLYEYNLFMFLVVLVWSLALVYAIV